MSRARYSSTSSSEKHALKRFYFGLAAPLLLCALYFSFATILLLRSGEYMPLDDIIAKQAKTGGRFGSAVLMRSYYFKQRLYKAVMPEVTTLGSSRVLGFRQEDFSKPFINLGSLSDLEEVSEVADAMLKIKAPALLILGVDFWWFHPNSENRVINRSPEDAHIEANDLFQPFSWMLSGRLKMKHIADILRGDSPDIGIGGISYQDGFDAAGAHYYTSIVTGQKAPEDFKFAVNIGKVRNSDRKYAHSDVISEIEWQKMLDLLDKLHAAGTHVLVFIPPLATPIYREMSKVGGYAYVAEFRKRLKAAAEKRGMPFFDYHEGGPPGSTDCEFVDGHHGGTLIYQRMLLDMATKDAELRGRLKLAGIGWNIEHYGGQASLLDNEVDFLGIGCKKPSMHPH